MHQHCEALNVTKCFKTFLLMATPSSQSKTIQSAPKVGIFDSFRSSFPGTYIKARRGTYFRVDFTTLANNTKTI